MFGVQYLCPRIGPGWRWLTGFFGSPKQFGSLEEAAGACNGLIWQYHSARVVGPSGEILYQV